MDWLYVLAYDWTTSKGPYKIGRTKNVEQRVAQLEASSAFRITVVAAIEGRGHLERRVHERLVMHRCTIGRGVEWYNVSVSEIIKAVSDAIEAEQLPRSPDRPLPVLHPSRYFEAP